MFETYTEAARRTIFIGLYEASQFGSESVEIEHLFLALLRADLNLAFRLFKSSEKLEEVRDRVERETPRKGGTISSSVDLPLSNQSQRVLNRAALEAGRRNQAYVAAEHLLLGIMQEKTSIAARIVAESGISLSQLEEEAGNVKEDAKAPVLPSTTQASARTVASYEFRDLVAEADNEKVAPLIGRERELEQVIQILLRRTKNSAVLIGEPGVGKEAIVHGLAHRIALGHVPAELADRKILVVDLPEFASAFTRPQSTWAPKNSFREKLAEFSQYGGPILYVRGLFDSRAAVPLLASYLKHQKLQLITTGAPLTFRLALDRDDELAHSFEAVSVLPPTDEDAIRILESAREDFERFYDVVLPGETIQAAVSASGRFLRHRPLPERAIDLIDDACTRVKLRRSAGAPEIRKLETRIRLVVRQMENAIVSHDFEKAKKLSEEERGTRKTIARLREELPKHEQSDTVSAEDVLEAIAVRMSLKVVQVKAALEEPQAPDKSDDIRSELASQIPVGRRDWVEGFFSYLTDCSMEETDRLLQSIRRAKKNLERDLPD